MLSLCAQRYYNQLIFYFAMPIFGLAAIWVWSLIKRLYFQYAAITTSPLHHLCTINAPSMHHQCTVTAPSLHRHCTITAPSMHYQCTVAVPSLRHHCTIPVRFLGHGDPEKALDDAWNNVQTFLFVLYPTLASGTITPPSPNRHGSITVQ